MITLDGSHLEGGGQIIRTSLALSTLKQEIVEIENIRHGRPQKGLKSQHLHCVRALQKFCDAKTNEIKVGTERLKFIPGKVKSGIMNIDIGTAGSITLMLQCLILPCIFMKKSKIKIIGGTDVKWSPSVDYWANVFLPHMKRFGDIKLSIEGRGYYPRGGGSVTLTINPKFSDIPKIKLTDQQKLLQIKGISHASDDLEKTGVAERQAKAASLALTKLGCPVNITSEYSSSLSTGSGITLWAIFGDESGINFDNPVILGADELGEKGKTSEAVGLNCANKLNAEINSGFPVDRHLADNLIPYLGLVGGEIRVSDITMHTRTNMWVVSEFLGDKFEIKNNIIKA